MPVHKIRRVQHQLFLWMSNPIPAVATQHGHILVVYVREERNEPWEVWSVQHHVQILNPSFCYPFHAQRSFGIPLLSGLPDLSEKLGRFLAHPRSITHGMAMLVVVTRRGPYSDIKLEGSRSQVHDFHKIVYKELPSLLAALAEIGVGELHSAVRGYLAVLIHNCQRSSFSFKTLPSVVTGCAPLIVPMVAPHRHVWDVPIASEF